MDVHRTNRSGLAEALADAALAMDAEPDLDRTLNQIVRAAAETIPGVEQAGAALLENGKIRTVAPTSPVLAQVDEAQIATGEGPCVSPDAGVVFRSGALADERRWPRFCHRVADLGPVSIMSFPLRSGSSTLGALTVLSWHPDAFDAEAEHVGHLFAMHATVALSGQMDRAQLRQAISTRDAIGMAKGILMHRHTIDDDAAFDMLSAASQRANVKLRDVAQWVIADANRIAEEHSRRPGDDS